MRVLFDQGTPAPLRLLLPLHEVSTAFERGWSTLKNGDLLQAAEAAGFGVLVTTDTNLKYQQNLATRKISIIVLGTTSWPRIKVDCEPIVLAIADAVPGGYLEIRVR